MRIGIAPVTATLAAGVALHGDRLLALAVALAGAGLARLVFVDRENRKLGRRQTLRETLPLTLVAMLISGVIVTDQGFGYSQAAFTGLGVGWAAITMLDSIGRRIADPGAGPKMVKLNAPVDDDDEEINEALRRLDEKTRSLDDDGR